MDTLSIMKDAHLIKNSCGDITTVSISILEYNYLCVATKRTNIFNSTRAGFIEMDVTLFIDLLTKAHMFEVDEYNTKFILEDEPLLKVV